MSSFPLFYPCPILFQWESFLDCDHLPRPENEAAVNSFLTAWEEEEDWVNIDTLLEGLREAEEVIMGNIHMQTHTHTHTHTHTLHCATTSQCLNPYTH